MLSELVKNYCLSLLAHELTKYSKKKISFTTDSQAWLLSDLLIEEIT